MRTILAITVFDLLLQAQTAEKKVEPAKTPAVSMELNLHEQVAFDSVNRQLDNLARQEEEAKRLRNSLARMSCESRGIAADVCEIVNGKVSEKPKLPPPPAKPAVDPAKGVKK